MLCSLKDLYRIGPGPSSSHTIGPYRICLDFLNSLEPNNYHYVVTLFGSLALTGKGHLTDKIIIDTLKDVEVKFDLKTTPSFPNTMQIEAYLDDKLETHQVLVDMLIKLGFARLDIDNGEKGGKLFSIFK